MKVIEYLVKKYRISNVTAYLVFFIHTNVCRVDSS